MPPIIRDDKDKKKCFIIMPISTPENWLQKYREDKDHFIHVLNHLLVPAIKEAGYEPISPITKGSELIHGEIIKNIESADLVLCDMSILNPNVFFELGIRTSLNRPICLIKDNLTTNVPFDLSMIGNYTYSSALDPWTLENEIDALVNHIKDSFEKCQGSNSLWKYFGLSSTAQPTKEEGSDAKIDFLTRQVEALREQLNKALPTSVQITDITPLPIILTRIRAIGENFGVVVESIARDGIGDIQIRVPKRLDKDLRTRVAQAVKREFPEIIIVNWSFPVVA